MNKFICSLALDLGKHFVFCIGPLGSLDFLAFMTFMCLGFYFLFSVVSVLHSLQFPLLDSALPPTPHHGRNLICLSRHLVLIFKYSISHIAPLKTMQQLSGIWYTVCRYQKKEWSSVRAAELSIKSTEWWWISWHHLIHCSLFISCLFKVWSGIARNFRTLWFVFL